MGFETMNPQKRREAASRGGKSTHEQGKAHKFTPEEASSAGKKGSEVLKKKYGPDHFARIGRIGGRKVSADTEHMRRIGRKGGHVVSQDKDHMVEIGGKGGRRSRPSQNLELPFEQ